MSRPGKKNVIGSDFDKEYLALTPPGPPCAPRGHRHDRDVPGHGSIRVALRGVHPGHRRSAMSAAPQRRSSRACGGKRDPLPAKPIDRPPLTRLGLRSVFTETSPGFLLQVGQAPILLPRVDARSVKNGSAAFDQRALATVTQLLECIGLRRLQCAAYRNPQPDDHPNSRTAVAADARDAGSAGVNLPGWDAAR
jgi:hypothetical protein